VYVGLTRDCVGDAAEEDRGTASAIFESTSHIGGAVAVSAYLSLFGAGLGYRATELIGAVVVACGAVSAFLILPRHDRKPSEAADAGAGHRKEDSR
jgi:predicted MFS family arabinose efflux permease